ncbi:endocuticle structural glycoprotein ABD-5-like [Rhagoletis pomonella]|uniref:endocuticle structural glycoprotein ABD-5 n=1 Tax=Rhagoletis pomonella TaxID=28610 RepID=UPI00178314A9|nr:endocuticle structural glycoprotein ABD-5 [Rhagoletis pomonella]XP_036337347.1 endocuticle structural glycoprotein ABD-5-like [Rhagoletis pomonella]
MKYEIVLLFVACFATVSLAAPRPDETDEKAETLRLETENNGVDKYSFAFDTSNGISRTEQGELKTIDDNAAIVVQGSTSWTSPEGKRFEIVFTADELGYHPSIKLVS